MRALPIIARAGLALVLLLGFQAPALAQPATGTAPLVIGVDHPDQANQQPFPPFNRLFEYADFFSRQVTIHSGDTLDFQSAPGSFHIVAFATDESVARSVYPVALLDREDPIPATSTGAPKIEFGPSNFPITGGSTHGGGSIAFNNGFGPTVCGVAALGQAPCTFSGGDDIEVTGPNVGLDSKGNPAVLDQLIKIVAPPGKYKYLCYIHPNMSGDLTVVDAGQPTTTQAQIDVASQQQYASERDQGIAAEKAADVMRYTGGDPGTRTYEVRVGAAGGDHVRIDEMFPTQPLSLAPGDQVHYVWQDQINLHTVTFPADGPNLPQPFGFDCGHGYIGIPNIPGAPPPAVCVEPGASQPEGIGDPGNVPSGTALSDPSQLVDAGVLLGPNFNGLTSVNAWSIVTNGSTKPGTYRYQCTIHDWMHGALQVQAAQLPGPVTGALAGTSGGAFAYYEIANPSGAATTITLNYSPFDAGQAHAVGFNVYQNGTLLGSAKGRATGLGDAVTSSAPSVTVTPSATGGTVLVQVFNYSTAAVSYSIASS